MPASLGDEFAEPLIADGQFVWGPNVGGFDPGEYLETFSSPLAAYGAEIELWGKYTSVSPMVLLTVLELRYGMVTGSLEGLSPDEVRQRIEGTAMDLAVPFYEHLHTWGARKPSSGMGEARSPLLVTTDGGLIQVEASTSSGSFAIATALAGSSDRETWSRQVSPGGNGSFVSVFGTLFPWVDPLDPSNNINPASLPPENLFQFPFPLGARWRFNGPHSWNGGSYPPPFSSMDFFAGGAVCSAPPNLWAVAASSGVATRPWGYSCWLEIDHGAGWATSYYHLLNTRGAGYVGQNETVGSIGCAICAGGFATGPHVHFSLKYNGAYASLEGVKLSGWTVHVGPVPYSSGSIERGPQVLLPGDLVLNDYHSYFATEELSLRFYGNGSAGIDRVLIPVDGPPRPADVIGDFTLEWWMKALPGENDSAGCIEAPDGWRLGNIIFDRDLSTNGAGGEYGVSLAGGRIAFGLRNATEGVTLCSNQQVDDRSWHYLAITRSTAGTLRIFVDGRLDREIMGPSGEIGYPDEYTSTFPYDPYLVVGAEKHDLGPEFPSFSGWIDEVRLSNQVLYTGDFQPPTGPLTASASTVGLFPFNEGSATTIWDVSGYPGGPSNGVLSYGGSPAGPVWSAVAPFGNSFTDVFGSYWAYDYVEAIAAAGQTAGYPDGSYRPENPVSRAEMAVFLKRGVHGPSYSLPLPDGSHPFDDVAGHWAEAWIEDLFDESLTSGFADGTFRPDSQVTRAELAVFLLRARHSDGYIPPPPQGNHPFIDIGGHWAEAWIERLWEEGLTSGYPDSTYRPDATVTRAEMAVFLVRGFDLPLP